MTTVAVVGVTGGWSIGPDKAGAQTPKRRATDWRHVVRRTTASYVWRTSLWEPPMTQQYIVGEFSALLGDLQPAPGEWVAAIDDLRRAVESSPLPMFPALAHDALSLTDMVCWAALERGQVNAFVGYAKTAVALREFAENARLMP